MRTRIILPAAALLAALLMATSARADDDPKDKKIKEPTAAQLKIAKAIAMGHAYEKHVVEEKLFPEVKNKDDFVEVIANVLANPTHHRELENDREAYFDKKSNTIVIYNPHARDKGTCFRPSAGLKYFEGLK
jgi:pyocin large subunit-like protein